jgi:hypothetical protein
MAIKMEAFIEENEKTYKNLIEIRAANTSAVLGALDVVQDFIRSRHRVLYGGMAIDYALKAAGNAGIYGEDIMPDFDFYSPENIIDSIKLADILLAAGFADTKSINGLHLTTRRVRIDKTAYVADISYYPQPYFSRIRTASYRGMLIVHQDFQRIDLHLSLSFLYGPPGFENFRNRLQKDIKRFNMIEDLLPFSTTHLEPAPPGTYSGMLLENFGTETTINMSTVPAEMCLMGYAALQFLKDPNIKKIKSPDPLELMTNKIEDCAGQKYEPTCDIFPESVVGENIIYYNNYGRLLSASKIGGRFVANIHYLCCTFLFKYFMLGESRFLDYYTECLNLIKKQGTNSRSAACINGYYYGSTQIFPPALLAAKEDNCKLEEREIETRPKIRPDIKTEDIKIENLQTYKIAGKKTDHFTDKTENCI